METLNRQSYHDALKGQLVRMPSISFHCKIFLGGIAGEIVRRVPLLRKLFVSLSIDRRDKNHVYNETLVNQL